MKLLNTRCRPIAEKHCRIKLLVDKVFDLPNGERGQAFWRCSANQLERLPPFMFRSFEILDIGRSLRNRRPTLRPLGCLRHVIVFVFTQDVVELALLAHVTGKLTLATITLLLLLLFPLILLAHLLDAPVLALLVGGTEFLRPLEVRGVLLRRCADNRGCFLHRLTLLRLDTLHECRCFDIVH